MIRIVIVEGKGLVRAGLISLLEAQRGLDVIGSAEEGEKAVELVRSQQPDVVVLDVHAPGLGGIETARRMLRAHARVAIVAIADRDDEAHAARLLQSGVLGCVSKDITTQELATAVRKVNVGQRYLSLDIAQRLALNRFDSEDANPFTLLSCRELEIAMMVVNCRRVQQISKLLCLSAKTVNSYRYRIFDKLDISSDVELTHLAVRHQMLQIPSSS